MIPQFLPPSPKTPYPLPKKKKSPQFLPKKNPNLTRTRPGGFVGKIWGGVFLVTFGKVCVCGGGFDTKTGFFVRTTQ